MLVKSLPARIQIILNCTFILFLFLPLLIFTITPIDKISQSEKRQLAVFPKVNQLAFSLTDFSKKFESYWNDHFGLRENIIAFNSNIQQKIFKKSPVKTVIQGKNGWLFFNIPSIVSDYLGISLPSSETLSYWLQTIENREKWLKKHNIHYLLLPVPSKMNIYPEYLPARYSLFKQGDGKTSLDLFFDYLDTQSDFKSIVHLKPIYFKVKEKTLLYHKTDTHWTWSGAHLAYTETLKKLKIWYPELEILPPTSLKSSRYKHSGDLALMLGSKSISSEKSTLIRVRKNSCSGKVSKLPHHDPTATKRHPMITTCDKANLTAVVVHDSFGSKLNPFLSQHFSRVTYVSMKDFDWLKEFLLIEKPDVFIHEQAARQIDMMLYDSWHLKEMLN